MTALLGSFVKVTTMADGTPRITLDLQCSLSDLAAIGCAPGDQFGIARVTNEAAQQAVTQKAEETQLGPLGKWAVMRCNEPEFQQFLGAISASDAKRALCDALGISSRKEIDTDIYASTKMRQIMQSWSASPFNPHKEQ